jgi:uncharacterized coiled-coil protein SlyX
LQNLKQEFSRLKENFDEKRMEELSKQVANQREVLKRLVQKVEANENNKPTFAEAVKSAQQKIEDMLKEEVNIQTKRLGEDRDKPLPSIMRRTIRIDRDDSQDGLAPAPAPAPEPKTPQRDFYIKDDLYKELDKEVDQNLVPILDDLTTSAQKMFRKTTGTETSEDDCDKQHPIIPLEDIEAACTLDPTNYPEICDETSWLNPARWFGTQGYPREDVLRNLHVVKQRNKECKEKLVLPPQYSEPDPEPQQTFLDAQPRQDTEQSSFLNSTPPDVSVPGQSEVTGNDSTQQFPPRFTIKDTPDMEQQNPDFTAPEGTREFKGGKKRRSKSKRRVRTRKRTRNRTPNRKRTRGKKR